MASGNDEAKGVLFLLAMAASAVFALAILAFVAVIAFILGATLFFTILCLCAWRRPFHGFGFTIYPWRARRMLVRGAIGGVLGPIIVWAAQPILDGPVQWSYWPWFVIAGYALGFLILQGFIEKFRELAAQGAEVEEPAKAPVPARVEVLPPRVHVQPPRFEFADWNDEELR